MLQRSLFAYADQVWAEDFIKNIARCKSIFFLDIQIRGAISQIQQSAGEKRALLGQLDAVLAVPGVVRVLRGTHRKEIAQQRQRLETQLAKLDTNYYLMRYIREKCAADAHARPFRAYCNLVLRWTSNSPNPLVILEASGRGKMATKSRVRSTCKTPSLGATSQKRNCSGCGRKCRETSSGGERVCVGCGLVQTRCKEASSFEDVQRLTTSKKYTYERKTHFKDTMAQYQGTQTDNVPEYVYTKLRLHLQISGLVNTRAKTKLGTYARVTRAHIWRMLSSLGLTAWNEDCSLLLHKITGKSPPDISAIEQELHEDFILFDKVYEGLPPELRLNRRNMANSQYVLAAFLTRRDYHVDPGDLSIMRTHTKIVEHDLICKRVFDKLGWTFTALADLFSGM